MQTGLKIEAMEQRNWGARHAACGLPGAGHGSLCYALSRDAIEARFAPRILPVSNAVMRRWGALAGRIKRETRHPPPVIDTLLAATALESSLYLVTRNTKDVIRTGAVIFNPWEDDPIRVVLYSASR